MDLEKVLFREIDNKSRIFLYKEGDCWSAHDNSARHLCFLYSQFNAFDRIYHAYEIVLKCVMLSNAMIEKFVEHTLVQTGRADEMEISIPEEKKADMSSPGSPGQYRQYGLSLSRSCKRRPLNEGPGSDDSYWSAQPYRGR